MGPRKRGNPPIIISPHGTQHQLPEPKSKKKGVLSILFIKNTDFVAATFPEANFLQIWDYKRQVVVKSFPLKNPRGLIMDTFNENESTFLVTSADDSTLSKVTIKQNEILLSKYEFKYGGKGAHISKILI